MFCPTSPCSSSLLADSDASFRGRQSAGGCNTLVPGLCRGVIYSYWRELRSFAGLQSDSLRWIEVAFAGRAEPTL